MTLSRKLICGASLAALMAGGTAYAQDEGGDELRQQTVTVTGSFIAGTPEDAALPVDVLTAQDLKLEGNPKITELIRNLGVSSGVDGQTNQFASNGLEGTSNVNLRGLGPARTLVLLNGRREAPAPYAIGEQAQLFVDTNMIPSAAIGRVEVLKDGAAALYGSDAIAGVVNFITRDDLDGFEVAGSFQQFDGTDGEYDISAAYGFQGNDWNWVTSVGYQFRNEAALLEKDWAILPFADNPVGGWSSIGNPGSFVATPNIGPGVAAAGTPLAFANSDDQCAALGGVDGGVLCRFQFTQFDNLTEEEERYQIFSEYNRTFSNGTELHLEALYGYTDVPEWKTSPSYPPQALFGNVVLPNHPGLVQYIADNPAWAAATFTDYSPLLTGGTPDVYDPVSNTGGLGLTPLVFFGRSFGWGGFPGTGGAQEGTRSYDHYRFSGDLAGEFQSGAAWELGLTYSKTEGSRYTNDSYTLGFINALQGFGVCSDPITGAIPTGAVAGQGGCEYYNPFSNAVAANAIDGTANPQFDASLANSTTLAEWLTDEVGDDRETSLLVFDGVISGQSNVEASGGSVGYAVGFQVRQETFKVTPNAVSNLAITPGPTGTGPFSFLAGGSAQDEDQTIYAVFGELQIPLFDNVDVQVATRYEDYGGEVGSTFDPKVAAKWQVNDSFALRGSAQTSFRGPTLNQLGGVGTTLQFIAPTGAFKAVDQFGNPNLSPESAFSFNLGGLFQQDGFSASIDYYNFDFSDPIIVEDQNAIVNAAIAALGAGQTSGGILDRITFANPTAPAASGIERIRANVVNGPDIETSGIDLGVSNVWDLGPGEFELALDTTYIIEYEVGDFDIEGVSIAGGDRVGQFNRSNFSRSLPQWKANVSANYGFGNHNLRGVMRHVDSYDDERAASARGNVGDTIDSQTTFDAFYTWQSDWDLDLGLSVVNITDEDPPFAAFDLNYDPYTHNPFGRTWKISVTKRFGAFGG
ncbi:MAG: TonB-dependent receptor [Hyphomonadaceae bacterium]|nr:TonB-dependent receptor [Hyphomonadaceae bacterium]